MSEAPVTADTLAREADTLLGLVEAEFANFQKRLEDLIRPFFVKIEASNVDKQLKIAVARKVMRGVDEIGERYG